MRGDYHSSLPGRIVFVAKETNPWKIDVMGLRPRETVDRFIEENDREYEHRRQKRFVQ